MKLHKRVVAPLILMAFLPAVGARGQEKPLKKADLPLAVQATVDAQSKGATIRGFSSEVEGGALHYGVELTVGGHSRDLSIAPDGRVLEIEEEVAWGVLPARVRAGLEKKAGAGKITKVESITKQGKLVAYEAQIVAGAKRSEIQVGPDGAPLAHDE